MKRWLSVIKKHVTPGVWTRASKKRRPITIMTEASILPPMQPLNINKGARSVAPVDIFYTAPLVPRPPRPPFSAARAEVDRIMLGEARLMRPRPKSVVREDSETLPLRVAPVPASAYVDYAFINFEPVYKVVVSEVTPYTLELRKPRAERFTRRIHSFFHGDPHGEVRFSAAIYLEE